MILVGALSSEYTRLDEFFPQHQVHLRLIREIMLDCGITSIALNDGGLQLTYKHGGPTVVERHEFI